MVYENNFRILGDRALVDPVLKIFVTMGRMHWDGEGVQVLHISHDPEMRSGILTRVSEWEAADKAGDEEKKSQLGRLDFSDQRFDFFSVNLEKITEGETLVLQIGATEEQFRLVNLSTLDGSMTYPCPDRKAFLLYVFRNLLLLPQLQRWGFGKCTKVQLRMTAAQFAALEDRPTERQSGTVIFDDRELEVMP